MDIIRVSHLLSFRHYIVIPLAILGFFQNFARSHVVPEQFAEVSHRMGHRSQLFWCTSQKNSTVSNPNNRTGGSISVNITSFLHTHDPSRTKPCTFMLVSGFPTPSIEINQIPSVERLSAPSPSIFSSLDSSLRIKTEKHNPSFISSLKGFLKTPITSTRLNSQMIALLKIRFNAVLILA